MRFQINRQKLASLLLASCTLSVSCLSLSAEGADGGASSHINVARQLGAIKLAAEPVLGGVSAASGTEAAGPSAYRIRPLTAAVLVAQPPKAQPQVPPPAAKGPDDLTVAPASPSDNKSANKPAQPSDNAANGNKLKTDSEPKAENRGNDAANQDSTGTRDKGKAGEGKNNGNSLTPMQNRDLTTIVHVVDLSVAGLGTGTIPEAAFDKRQTEATYGRLAVQKCVYWQPSDICHYPLRFEETMLERHGHVRAGCLQPIVSGVRFFTTIPMIPYLYTLQPSCQPVYALGNYRPGSCAPMLRDTIPYDKHAAVVEALSVAGFFWAMPL